MIIINDEGDVICSPKTGPDGVRDMDSFSGAGHFKLFDVD